MNAAELAVEGARLTLSEARVEGADDKALAALRAKARDAEDTVRELSEAITLSDIEISKLEAAEAAEADRKQRIAFDEPSRSA